MKFSTRYVKVNTCQLEGKKLHSKGSKDDMIRDYQHTSRIVVPLIQGAA